MNVKQTSFRFKKKSQAEMNETQKDTRWDRHKDHQKVNRNEKNRKTKSSGHDSSYGNNNSEGV